MSYAERILEQVKAKNADQPEFIQAATEILGTLEPALDAHPEYEENALLERFVEPERVIMFRVSGSVTAHKSTCLRPDSGSMLSSMKRAALSAAR